MGSSLLRAYLLLHGDFRLDPFQVLGLDRVVPPLAVFAFVFMTGHMAPLHCRLLSVLCRVPNFLAYYKSLLLFYQLKSI